MDWKELFGSDDEEEHDEQIIKSEAIPGLKLIKQGLNHDEQMTLTNHLINNNYFSGENGNQAMCFGTLPPYIQWLSDWVMEKYPTIFPQDIMNRYPLFDQAILNLYKEGEGIRSHIDLLRFEDGILIVSLLSSCVMTMRPAAADAIHSSATSYQQQSKNNEKAEEEIDILLCPGDVLALSGDARYKWQHGIKEQLYDEYQDEIIKRGTRISVTLRKLIDSRHNSGTTMTGEMTQTSR